MRLSKEERESELAIVLAIAFWTATLCFWLSDIADTGRRRAGVLSFTLLAAGHAGLGFSSTMRTITASAVFFGIGEGFSTGLRALVGNDYCLHDDSLVASKKDRASRSATGYFDEQQCLSFRAMCGVWADATIVMNALIVGVVGHVFGMRSASLSYAGLSAVAVA